MSSRPQAATTSRTSWRAAAWRLERRAPQRWGARRARRAQTASSRAQIKHLVGELLAELACNQQHDPIDDPDQDGRIDEIDDAEEDEADGPAPAVAAPAQTAPLPAALERALFGERPTGKGIAALVSDLRNSACLRSVPRKG